MENTSDYPVCLLCKSMQVSRSAYYEWLKRKPSHRGVLNQRLRELIGPEFEHSKGTYGRRRLTASLGKKGVKVSINRVERRMQEMAIKGHRPKAFKKTTKAEANVENSPNLLKQEKIKPNGCNQVWVSDITYISTKEGWLYLCVVLDLYSRKIVGWSMDDNMKASLVTTAVQSAFGSRKAEKALIFHSDCGGQYKSKKFRRLLQRKNVRQSMTNAGNCYDNATAESFFGTLKNELIRGGKFDDRDQAKNAIFEYVEIFYNRIRLHSSLDYNSPAEFEKVA